MPENGVEIIGAYSYGLKADLGNNKKKIFVTGQIAQDKDGNVVCDDIEKNKINVNSFRNVTKKHTCKLLKYV